ncbi:MAG: hypothetical protein KDA41_09500 [Planctomycetales bacterium]|nr:hypothetical protein [Planctomycetales bacterium]
MKFSFVARALVIHSVVGVFWLGGLAPAGAQAAEPKQASVEAQPVEADMHEFMEYVFQPTYKRLKQAMAAAPADGAAWKGVKSDALILAEGSNLLLFRGPDKDRAAWGEHSAAVRASGGMLYQAAKKKDYAAASESYKAMLTKCNACHNAFADGEHQLSP